jgi:hypothetical protein
VDNPHGEVWAQSAVQTGKGRQSGEGVYLDVLDRTELTTLARINSAMCPHPVLCIGCVRLYYVVQYRCGAVPAGILSGRKKADKKTGTLRFPFLCPAFFLSVVCIKPFPEGTLDVKILNCRNIQNHNFFVCAPAPRIFPYLSFTIIRHFTAFWYDTTFATPLSTV